jgi:murein DD-endopeptidase MepM/ murein hydrolase activator NlpD
MRKILLILLLSFGLNNTFFSSDPINSNIRTEYENAVLKRDFYSLKEQILQTLENKRREKFNDIVNLPITSPIKTNEINRIGDMFNIRLHHPILKVKKFHSGIDFVANLGTNVYCTAPGVVMKINKSRFKYGNQILIYHENGFMTRYAHLNKILVKEGQIIQRNTIIGEVGSTGLSTGPHLHYEILYMGIRINPLYMYFINISEKSREEYLDILIKLENFNSKQLLSNI